MFQLMFAVQLDCGVEKGQLVSTPGRIYGLSVMTLDAVIYPRQDLRRVSAFPVRLFISSAQAAVKRHWSKLLTVMPTK